MSASLSGSGRARLAEWDEVMKILLSEEGEEPLIINGPAFQRDST